MKVVVKAESLRALLDVKKKAEAEGLHAELIEDRGLTQIPPGTVTCLAIGPSDSAAVDKVTGGMKLL
jgi:PTH2 family peptidyl-tRNA hydrolase